MPKTTAPLLSFDARGQIAKTQVYSSWRGISYVRRYAIPNNPRTLAQVAVRSIFAMLNQVWLFAPAIARAPWDAYATGRPFIGRNALISKNSNLLSGPPVAADLEGFVFSPGARGGLPPSALVIVGGVDQITVSATMPDPPEGWTLVASIAAAIPNLDPADPFGGEWHVNRDTVTPESNVIPGITSAAEHVVGFWLEWMKPDGSTAYSVSLSGLGTPT